jgi:hypothetical protein
MYAGGEEGGALEEPVRRVVRRAFLHTEEAVPHGRLMGMMNMLRAGEYLKIAFVAW